MQKSKKSKTNDSINNVNDLRKVLLDGIQKLRVGQLKYQDLNAVSSASGKVIALTKLQLEYQKEQNALTPKGHNIPFMLAKV